jgi:hypothetical protein
MLENDNAEKTSRDLMLMTDKPNDVPINNIGPDHSISAVSENKEIIKDNLIINAYNVRSVVLNRCASVHESTMDFF